MSGAAPAPAPGETAVAETLGLLRAWAGQGEPAAPRTSLLKLLDFAQTQKVGQPVAQTLARVLPEGPRRLLLDPVLAAAEQDAAARLRDLGLAAAPLLAAGIVPVALKGVAFAAAAGAPQPWRRMVDVDLLVAPDRLTDALVALREAGWTGPDGQVHLKIWGCYAHPSLFHPDASCALEVHVRCSYEAHGALEGMHGRAVPSALPDILVPSPEDRVAHLAHHAQLMGRRSPRRLVELRDALDWRRLLEREDPDLDAVTARFERVGDGLAFRRFATLMERIWERPPPIAPAGDEVRWAEETLAGLADPAAVAGHLRGDYRRAAWEMATRRGMLNEYASRLLVKPHRDTTLPRITAMLRRLGGGEKA